MTSRLIPSNIQTRARAREFAASSSGPQVGIGKQQSILVAAILSILMVMLPVEPNIWVALIHTVCWAIFVKYSVGTHFLWQPGPASWFILTTVISFGSWTPFYITGSLFFPNTDSFLSVCQFPETGFKADTGSFVFTTIAWSVIRLLCSGGAFATNHSQINFQKCLLSTDRQVFVLGCGVVGAVAGLPGVQAIGALAQPLLLLSYWFKASLAISLLGAARAGSFFLQLQFCIFQILVIGFLGFMTSGSKGLVFLTLFLFAWLFGGVYPSYRKRAVVSITSVLAAFIITLPAFQLAKEAFSRTQSSSKTVETLADGIEKQLMGKLKFGQGSVKGPAESLWEYLGIRLCVAGSTQKYYDAYSVRPHPTGTVNIAIDTMLPRLLAPNKASSNTLYNEIARESGIGGSDDYTTSRKPSFIDESIINWGANGLLIGGVLFGLYIAAVEFLLFKACDSMPKLIVMRFSALTLGQLPYLAVIFGATPYVVIFLLLTVRTLLNKLWPKPIAGR